MGSDFDPDFDLDSEFGFDTDPDSDSGAVSGVDLDFDRGVDVVFSLFVLSRKRL